jgi:hypothetical protein
MTYTSKDVGCHADGTFGDRHLRQRLSEMVGSGFPSLRAELLNPYEDECDDSVETAMAVLQDLTEEGLYWELIGGDLFLLRDSGE